MSLDLIKTELTANVGRRVILRGKFPNADELREVIIVEVSPSRKHVKFRSQSGAESWEDIATMDETIEEVLP